MPKFPIPIPVKKWDFIDSNENLATSSLLKNRYWFKYSVISFGNLFEPNDNIMFGKITESTRSTNNKFLIISILVGFQLLIEIFLLPKSGFLGLKK